MFKPDDYCFRTFDVNGKFSTIIYQVDAVYSDKFIGHATDTTSKKLPKHSNLYRRSELYTKCKSSFIMDLLLEYPEEFI